MAGQSFVVDKRVVAGTGLTILLGLVVPSSVAGRDSAGRPLRRLAGRYAAVDSFADRGWTAPDPERKA
jgi:hypothetical protein